MACSKCKQKNSFTDEMKNNSQLVPKGVIVFTIVWFFLGLYGLIDLLSFLKKLL